MQTTSKKIILHSSSFSFVSLTKFLEKQEVEYFNAETIYGKMTIIFERLSESKKKNLQYFEIRNQLIENKTILTPLIYEQKIVENEGCITILEQILLNDNNNIFPCKCEKLIHTGLNLKKTKFNYLIEGYEFKSMFKSILTANFYYDFTLIEKKEQCENRCEEFNFFIKQFLKEITPLYHLKDDKKINEIMFIKEIPVILNLEKINQATSWLDLALLLNLTPSLEVLVFGAKEKIKKVSKLSNVNSFECENEIFKSCEYKDGLRIDAFESLNYDKLQKYFFEKNVSYHICKDKYVSVKKQIIPEGKKIGERIYDDIIYVNVEISRFEFMNFLLAYLEEIRPILLCVEFNKLTNNLYLIFLNRQCVEKKVYIYFDKKYVLKDEELIIILDKTKLENATLILKEMDIGESFIIFLTNFERSSQIISLDISYCPRITESVINAFLESESSKSLRILKTSAIPINLSLVSCLNLKELEVNECKPGSDEEVSFAKLKLIKLEASGMNVLFNFSESLTYLILTCDIPVENLRFLKNLRLKHLQIKLVEIKKNIVNFFTSIYKPESALKQFATGESSTTLKIINLSKSSLRWKELKPLFYMEALENIFLEDYEKDKIGDIISLPENINSLSIKNTKINQEEIKELIFKIENINFLNIVGTLIKDEEVISICKNKKIQTISIHENQILIDFFQTNVKIKKINFIIEKLLNIENQEIFNEIICLISMRDTEINFICSKNKENILCKFIYQHLCFHQHKKKEHSLNSSFFINETSLEWEKIKKETSEMIIVLFEEKKPLKLLMKKNIFIKKDSLSIEGYLFTLYNTIKEYPNCFLELSIRGNRIIGRESLEILLKTAKNSLKVLDFRDCLFTFNEVRNIIWQFTNLMSVNGGNYEICFTKDNFDEEMQQYLKFFMKICKEDMCLHAKLEEIPESDLIYSVLCHLISHHCLNLIDFVFESEIFTISSDVLYFFEKVASLKRLTNLSISFESEDDDVNEELELEIKKVFEKFNELPLRIVHLKVSPKILPSSFLMKDLKKISLNVEKSHINDLSLGRLFKETLKISSLKIYGSYCVNIINISRLIAGIEKMNCLEIFFLEIDGCAVKEQQIFELIKTLKNCILLKELNIQARGCIKNSSELVNALFDLNSELRFCQIEINALNERTNHFIPNQRNLQQKNITLIL